MSDEIREQLSALVDDELNELEQPLLLGRLQRDPALQECMGRYQLIGKSLRGASQMGTGSVASRVQAALADGAGTRSPCDSAQESGGWWNPVAGFAVAASVALVAVMTVTSVRDTADEGVPAIALLDDSPAVVAPVSEQQWDRLEPQIDKRLSGYLVNHSEYAASRGMQSVVPYARVVGYENDMR